MKDTESRTEGGRWRYVITFAVTVPLTLFSTSASTRYKKKYLILSPTLACHLCSHPSNCQYVSRMSTNSPGCRDPRQPQKRIDLRHVFTDHTLNIEYTEKMSRSRILSCHPCFQRSDYLNSRGAPPPPPPPPLKNNPKKQQQTNNNNNNNNKNNYINKQTNKQKLLPVSYFWSAVSAENQQEPREQGAAFTQLMPCSCGSSSS